MKKVLTFVSLSIVFLFLANCGSVNYAGKLDVYGIGAGPEPEKESANYVDKSKLKHVNVAYTPNLIIKEQQADNETADKVIKNVAGDAVARIFEGEPELLAAWLSEKQDLNNVALLLDKNGVVAWHGTFDKQRIQDVIGTEGWRVLGGAQRITFAEALKKYVDKLDTQKHKEDKKISFEKGFFDYGKEGPFVYAKLPAFKVKSSNGKEIDIGEVTSNGKPTLLIFFMSEPRKKYAADNVKAAIGMFTGAGGSTKQPPQKVLNYIETGYFSE